MNNNEADMVIARMIAAWVPLDPSTRAVWREHLSKFDYQIALSAQKVLEESNPRKPSIAEFRAAYRMEAERNRPSALDGGNDCCDAETAHYYVDQVREMLLAARKLLPDSLTTAPSRRGKQSFMSGAPSQRPGTKTGRSPEFHSLRYEQVYDENGKAR